MGEGLPLPERFQEKQNQLLYLNTVLHYLQAWKPSKSINFLYKRTKQSWVRAWSKGVSYMQIQDRVFTPNERAKSSSNQKSARY